MFAIARLALLALLAFPAAAWALDPAAPSIVQRVSHDGFTLKLKLTKLPLRGPHFDIRVQDASGYRRVRAPIGERSFIGTVRGRPDAYAAGIVTAKGQLRAAIVFDRGGTWFTRGRKVIETRGLDTPEFAWPTKPNLVPGLAGTVVRAWDLAVDTDNAYFQARGSSVSAVLEEVEYGVSVVRAIYLHDALLVPRLARVVVRTSDTADPYGEDSFLGATRDHWRAAQQDAKRDEVLMVHASGGGGGVAYATDMNPDFAYATAGADDDGRFDIVARHEIGHNFDLDDNHAGGPEGATIIEGNQYARLGGPELQTVLASRLARRRIYDTVGRFKTVRLPPYAALDLADGVAPGSATTVDVLANDHDPNGTRVRLRSVDAQTAAGGTAAIQNGKVVYMPPPGPFTLDSFSYRIRDPRGQIATGVVLARP